MNSLYWQIVNQLQAYLMGLESLDQFEDWFVSQSWDAHKADDLAGMELVADIELRLSEFSNGHWGEDELRRLLSEKVFAAMPREVRTDTTAAVSHQEVVFPLGSTTDYIESPLVLV